MFKNLKIVSIDYYYDIVSIPAWILLERLSSICTDSIRFNFRPIHAATLLTSIGNQVPYSTPALKKNYFEEQRLFSRLHGVTIKTSHDIIDNLLYGMSNSLVPQLALNMISAEYGHSKLLDFSRILWRRLWIENKPVHTEEGVIQALSEIDLNPAPRLELISDEKWCTMLNSWHNHALNANCFGVPWTVLHFEDGSENNFFGSDRWPLICAHLQIPCKTFGDIVLPR